REMVRVLKPGGKLFMGVNGLGYYWMYVLNGLRYKSTAKMRFGLRGLFASWLKWMGMGQVGATCVTHNEMKVMFNRHGLDLIQSRLWLPQDYYPLEHFGFPTNYGFVAVKRDIE
ncbi:MAG: hypothetical protein MI864_16355, partial [Pseudomonadales bacterium]|nr:hypothetical protein [Pseudomonadales bacterium]